VLKRWCRAGFLTEPAQGHEKALSLQPEEIAAQIRQPYPAQQFENPANPAIHEKNHRAGNLEKNRRQFIDVLFRRGHGGYHYRRFRVISRTLQENILSVAVEACQLTGDYPDARWPGVKASPHKISGHRRRVLAGLNLDMSLVDRIEQAQTKRVQGLWRCG